MIAIQVLYIVTCLFHPLHYSPSSPNPLLKMTLMGFSVPCSYMCRKYLNHIHPPLSSWFTLPPPTSTFHLIWPVLHSCPLFKCLFIVQWSFGLVFYLKIYCTLISQTHYVTLPYPFLPSPVFSVFCFVLFPYSCGVFQ
jgi:hypothetical protein